MVQLKKMGFNMIRKHIKVEPEQYYYYADSLGLMIDVYKRQEVASASNFFRSAIRASFSAP